MEDPRDFGRRRRSDANDGGSNGESDFTLRMCKKVAQLTKVIYQLNCKNEDHEVEVAFLKAQQAAAIAAVIKDAERKVQCVEEAMEDMGARHEQERQKTIQCAQSVQEALTGEVASAKKSFGEQTRRMRDELALAKVNMEDSIRQLQSKLEGERAFLKKKDLETENLVREYNAKYNDMLAEQHQMREDLEKQLTGEWVAKVRAAEKQLSSQAGSADRAVAEERKRACDLCDSLADAQSEITALREVATQKAAKQEELEKLLGKTKAEVELLRASLGKWQLEGERQRCWLEEKEAELGEAQQNLQRVSRQLDSAQVNITTLENDLSAISAQRNALQHEIQVRDKRLSAVEAELNTVSTEWKRASSRETAEGEQLRRELEALRAVLDDTIERAQRTVDQYKAEIEALKSQHREQISLLTARSESAAITQRKTLTEEHARELKVVRATLEKREQDLTTQLATTKRLSSEAIEQQKAALGTLHKKEVDGLKRQMEALVKELACIRETASSESGSLAESLEQARSTAAAQAQAHKEVVEGLQRSLEEAKGNTQRLQQLLDVEREDSKLRVSNLQDQAKSSVEELERTHKKTVASLTAEHRAAIEQLRHEHQNSCTKQRQQWDSEATRARDAALLQCEQRWREAVACAVAEERRAAEEREAKLKLEMGGVLTRENAERDRVNRDMAAVHAKLDAVQRANAETLARVRQEASDAQQRSAAAQTSMEKRLEAEKREALGAQAKEMQNHIDRLRREMDALSASHKKQLDAAYVEFGAAHRDQDERHARHMREQQDNLEEVKQRALSSLKKQWDHDVSQRECTAAEALRNVREAKVAVDEKVCNLQAELRACSADLSEALATRDALTRGMEKLSEDHDNEVRKMMAAFQSERRAEEEKYAAEKLTVSEQHASEMESARQQRRSAENAHKVAMKELQRCLADLQHRYDYRESRKEDVVLINDLMRQLQEKDAMLAEAQDDLKQYKLELVNREENYNKMFGRKPKVLSATVSTTTTTAANSTATTTAIITGGTGTTSLGGRVSKRASVAGVSAQSTGGVIIGHREVSNIDLPSDASNSLPSILPRRSLPRQSLF